MLQKTLGHVIAGFGAHGTKARRKSDSQWITSDFNPDGKTFKERYGFTLEETNGSPVGERGPSDDLQDVIRNPDNPFMIENNLTYQVRTYWDVCDCRYVITSGGETAYDKLVKPVLDKYAPDVVVVTKPPVEPLTPPVITPVTPPASQPDVSVALEALQLKYTTLLKDHQSLIRKLELIPRSYDELPTRGGGKWVNVVRSIYDDLSRLTTDAKNKPR